MNFSGFASGFYSFFDWLMRLAILNILWILFTLLGLVFFGWAPATVAMFSVIRRRLLKNEEFPIVKTFFSYYKKDFWKANLIGLIVTLGLLTLFVSTQLFAYMQGLELIIFGVIVAFFAVLFTIFFIFIFPVFVHYDTSLHKSFQYALMIGIAHLHYCFYILFGFAMIAILVYILPTLILFYGASFTITFVAIVALTIFTKMEEKQTQLQGHLNANA